MTVWEEAPTAPRKCAPQVRPQEADGFVSARARGQGDHNVIAPASALGAASQAGR
jgi:hypothetical protein